MTLRRFLTELFDTIGIVHFEPEEFLLGSEDPPMAIWSHIVPTAMMLEEIRNYSGGPLHINSGYRDPAYNASIGGAENSQHIHFRAADVRSDVWTPLELYQYVDQHEDRELYGLGIYNTFVHIDCRYADGFNMYADGFPARWDQR